MRILLWPMAFFLALGFLMGGRRNTLEARVLRGRWSPGLLRIVVLILVAFGAGRRAEGQAQPTAARGEDVVPAFGGIPGNVKVVPLSVNGKKVEIEDFAVARSKEFPAALTQAGVQAWAFDETGRGLWARVQAVVSGLRSADRARQDEALRLLGVGEGVGLLANMAHFTELLRGERPLDVKAVDAASEDLMAAAREMAASGYYNVWGTTYLWGRSLSHAEVKDVEKLAALYALLEDCMRADNALRLAQAEVGPIVVTGWMSKASPSARNVVLPANYIATAEKIFATTDAGLFETEGAIAFYMPEKKSGAVLVRRGQKIELGVKAFVRLRRLDILVTGDEAVTVTHRLLGELVLPAKTVVTARNVETFLTADARKKIGEWCGAAMDGDSDALQLLEMALPAAAPAMRAELAKIEGRGAAAFRMVLQEYDGE